MLVNRTPPSRPRRIARTTSKSARLLIVLLLVLFLGGGLWATIRLWKLWNATLALQTDLGVLESLAADGIQGLDPQVALELLRTTRGDLETLRATARPFLWMAPHMGWIPEYGADIQAAPALLDMALDLGTAGEQVIDALTPLLAQVSGEQHAAPQALLQQGLATLTAARPQLENALSAVHRAQSKRKEMLAHELSPRLQGWLVRLDRYLPLMEPAIRAALVLPELLGADGPRTYLVLIQNQDELRATGGFISAVAEVTVENGLLSGLSFEDSYDVDDLAQSYPPPPSPLLEYMLSGLWVFRDSNWSPDFPTSARKAIELYNISRDTPIDGVIALDQEAIRLLVGALGALQVEGYAEPITAENVIQIARQAWEPGEEVTGEWWEHRKDIIGTVLEATLRRLESGLDGATVERVARAAMLAVDTRHLFVYVADAETAAQIAELGVDGALRAPPGDYVMVVDTNMGFNKADALVERSLDYLADLTDPDHPRAKLTIRYTHPLGQSESACIQEPRYDATYQQMMERCYWDYLRVYTPLGIELLRATPHSVPGNALLSGQPSPAQVTVGPAELGHEVLATFFLLHRGESLETQFEYALPKSVLHVEGGQSEYTLLVQKQPGTLSVPLRVGILLPPGSRVETSEPQAALASGSALQYNLVLDTDQLVRVTLQLGDR